MNSELNKKLDLILKNQDLILKNERKILSKEENIEELEEELKSEDSVQKSEEETLQRLNLLQNKLKNTIESPIKKVTKRDVFKGFIGAFVGVMSHFAFSKAIDIANELSFLRATILYIVAFIIIVIMLYYTGFKKVEKKIILQFIPLRATVLYTVSIITIILVNLLFGKIHFPINFMEIYTIIAANAILAVIGAGTADLIGRIEE